MSFVPTFLENLIEERDRLNRDIFVPWEISKVIGTSKTGEAVDNESGVVKIE